MNALYAETWRDVPGYEGLYQVSDQGRVKSVDGIRFNGHVRHLFKGRVLSQAGKTARYYHVVLSKDCKLKTRKVHELVAEVFLPPCPGKRGRAGWHIDHINNDPKDNRAVNLQWLTHRDNTYVKPNRSRDSFGRFQ